MKTGVFRLKMSPTELKTNCCLIVESIVVVFFPIEESEVRCVTTSTSFNPIVSCAFSRHEHNTGSKADPRMILYKILFKTKRYVIVTPVPGSFNIYLTGRSSDLFCPVRLPGPVAQWQRMTRHL
jgi:hypothetical protein